MVLWATLFGFFAGALYDAFRIRRIAVRIPILWHFEDFFFIVLSAVVFAVIFFIWSDGKVRAIAFGGAVLGFVTYRYTLGRLVMAASDRIIRFIKYIVKRILLPPVRFLISLIKKAFGALKGIFVLLWQRITLVFAKKRTKRELKAFSYAASRGFERSARSDRNGQKRAKIKNKKQKQKTKIKKQKINEKGKRREKR